MGLSQPLACFTVGGVGYGAGIEDVDIRLTDVCNQFIPTINQFPRQKLRLCLVKLATQGVQGNLYYLYIALLMSKTLSRQWRERGQIQSLTMTG